MAILEQEQDAQAVSSIPLPEVIPLPASHSSSEVLDRGEDAPVIALPLAEIIPVPENPWLTIPHPADLKMYIYDDPGQEKWLDISVLEADWTGEEGLHEPKVRLRVYQSADAMRVFDVVRPPHWGSDTRSSAEQAEEHRIAMAEALRTLIDPDRVNPLSQSPYFPPSKVEFLNMTGVAAEALAGLGIPEHCQRQDSLVIDGENLLSLTTGEAISRGGKLSTTFSFDRKNFQ